MKKILYIAFATLFSLSLVSCEDFLDTKNYYSKDSSNFPLNATDASQMITGIYNNLNVCLENSVHLNHFIWDNICSDDCLGGGGNDDVDAQAEDLLMNNGADMYNDFYTDRYKGIARANAVIETLASCGVSEDQLMQYFGEAFFLRAWFYYEIGSMFGNIPCPVKSKADATLPQISGEALWGQIIEDCKIAADIMPAKKAIGDGHVDKYCAEALMGRAYLFASGFYGLSDITLPAYTNDDIKVNIPEGTKISREDVGKYIKDCVDNSGYTLVNDPHNLWSYTNRCSVEHEDSPYKGNGYKWCMDDGAVNPEAMFMIKFNTQADWGTTMGYSNFTSLYMGVRGQENNEDHFPFGKGWGMAQVSPQLVIDWQNAEPNDKRRDASIVSVEQFNDYTFNGENNVQETGYYQAKIQPVTAYDENGECRSSFFNVMYPGLAYASGDSEDKDYNMLADQVLIRFAEVLLMDAEINNNQASFDAVRERAGLRSKPINEENIRNERRWELCFEGVRFGDLRRYGVDYCAAALDKQDGVPCHNMSEDLGTNHASQFNGGYGNRYKATKGFVKIPSSQIALSAGAGEQYRFTQNEGWGNGSDFSGWTN